MSDEKNATTRIEVGGSAAYEVTLEAAALRVLSGPDADHQETFALPTVRVGSAEENDFVVRDPSVSRFHAELRFQEGALRLVDLESTNGTWVNGVKVREVEVAPGQRIQLGEAEVQVRTTEARRQAAVPEKARCGLLVGGSPSMRELYGMLEAAAPTPATVLVQGESGTGKELVARTLHELSGREGPFVVFDAAATDPQMVRSDLFGHVKGAFTGAESARDGVFRRAHGGTVFLDEIGELPLDLQPRLLRVLEGREVTPIGADTPQKVDVRVVSATHRDLKGMIASGEFRRDLYHRLAIVRVRMPPLRERPEDVPLLIDHFLEELGVPLDLTDDARVRLASHAWPGNVRELRNELERLMAIARDRTIGPDDLDLDDDEISPAAPPPAVDPERIRIELALERNRGNKAATARELDMSLSTLKRRLKEYEEEG